MNRLELSDKELSYLRYLLSVHGFTEEFESEKEEKETLKIVEKLYKKLGVN